MAAVIFSGNYLKSLASGGLPLSITTQTSNYTALISDDVILGNTNAFTVTLPAASGNSGKVLRIKKIGSDANTVTVSRAGSDTIEGATTYALASQYQEVVLVSDGTATWYIIGHAFWA